MLRKKIWITGDSLPSRTNHLQGGSGSLTPTIVNDYISLSFANPNPYLYVDLSGISDYVIQSGDYIEYDIYWETAGALLIAMDLTTSVGHTLRDSGAFDQNGLGVHVSTDISAQCSGKWYHRKIPITTLAGAPNAVGETIQYFDVACEMDSASTLVARIRNMAITDGNGFTTIKKITGLQNTTVRTVKKVAGNEIERIKKISGVLNI